MSKKIKLDSLYISIVSICLVFLYFCHGDNYLILWKRIPSIFFFALSCLLIFPFLAYKKVINGLFRNKLLFYFILLSSVLLVLATISFVPFLGFTTNFAYLKTTLLNFLIMLVCMIFFSSKGSIDITLKIMVYGVLLAVALNIYDITHIDNYYFSTDDPRNRRAFSMVFARAAGFYLDPNVSASALVFGLILTENTIANKRLKFLYVLAVGGAVGITLSLSGVLFFSVYFFLRFIYGKVKLNIVLIVAVLFVIISAVIRDLMERKVIYFGPGITARIKAITNPFEGGQGEIVEKNSRTILLENAIEMILEDPVFGKGIGQHQFVETEQSARSRSGTHAGPHNQWLAFVIDYGLILGAGLFALIFFVLMPLKHSIYRKEVFYFLITYFLYSLFSHTALKNHSLMFLLPLVYQMGRIRKNERGSENK
ncbi:O-antigen ligase family protein [Hyunsoonleella rubra]|uniref:O-antigen ligase family protein n=1 Tax=Hyunsoonleella rubra TaxID=1737062 RepID=A0ABW5T687_9FLAO